MPLSTPPRQFQIIPATTASHIETAKSLITAYAKWTNLDLTFQGFSSELESLATEYGTPQRGALYLAYSTETDGQVLGCIAVRALKSKAGTAQPAIADNGRPPCCEMKRLYVTDEARGLGVGRALVETIVRRAKELGYGEMRLDTLPWMEGAIALYKRMGFVEIPAYYETPLERTVFLSLDLR